MKKNQEDVTKLETDRIKEAFLEHYKNAKTELVFKNEYELLISIILSAQCTDKRVNIITPPLFERFCDLSSLSKADIEEVRRLLGSCSYFNAKAKNIIGMAKSVIENFGGTMPMTEKELMSLPGVGQKTAHVFLCEFLGQNYMAVDTHVFRVSHRLGLSGAKTASKTEAELVLAFKTKLNTLHQAMVLFGRYICTAKKPKCEECFLTEFCRFKENFKPA